MISDPLGACQSSGAAAAAHSKPSSQSSQMITCSYRDTSPLSISATGSGAGVGVQPASIKTPAITAALSRKVTSQDHQRAQRFEDQQVPDV